MKAQSMLLATSFACVAAVACAEVPEGVQEIAGLIGSKPHEMKNCAFWANEAAAAARSRDRGVRQDASENAVPLSAQPTDYESDLHARRVEVVAQVYEDDDLQKLSPKTLHDAVFQYCRDSTR